MDELSAGFAAAKTYLQKYVDELPFFLKPEAATFITDERIRELVAAILDASHQVQAQATADLTPTPRTSADV